VSPTPTKSPTPTVSPTPSPTPFYDAVGVVHTIPTQIPASHAVPVAITIKNTGNTAWTAAAGYSLAVITDACGLAPGTRLGIDAAVTVEPNQSYAFTTLLTGPAATGTCAIEFRMVLEFVTFFGETLTLNPEIVPPLNDATPVSNTVPLTMAPGQSLGVGITFKNTGNTTWLGPNYALSVRSDTRGLFNTTRMEVPSWDAVVPNKSEQFIGYITAPLTLGPCIVTLRPVEGDTAFGTALTLNVSVVTPPNAAEDWRFYE
jgi:hypothetical protein